MHNPKILLTNPLPETMKLRRLEIGKVYEVEFISYNLESDMKAGRTKGYRVNDLDGKPITLYAEEVLVINDEF